MRIFYRIKYLFQKLFRGYSDCELWGLDYTIVEFILPRLKTFKKMEKHGFPCGLTENKWNKILDKMIWSLENYINDDLLVLKKHTKDEWSKIEKEIKEKYRDDEVNQKFYLMWNKYKIDKIKTEKNEKKFQEGWDLFHKYFFNLWD